MADGRKATLVFPCCVPEGVAYAAAARQRGEPVVASSSLSYDVTAGKFETWFRLPTVYDSDFVPQLRDAVARYDIARLYCPVATAHLALTRLWRQGELAIPIIGEMPAERLIRQHRDLKTTAVAAYGAIQAIADGRSPLSVLEVASALRQAFAILGESDEAKIAAMMAIFADAPTGDCVEIGVLAGRTACVLALMAQRHRTGAVLAVDPWSLTEAAQRKSTGDVQAAVDGGKPQACSRALSSRCCRSRRLADLTTLQFHPARPSANGRKREAWNLHFSARSITVARSPFSILTAITILPGCRKTAHCGCPTWLPAAGWSSMITFLSIATGPARSAMPC